MAPQNLDRMKLVFWIRTRVRGIPLHKLPRTLLTLEKRTAALRTLLSQNATEYKLLKAAEKVRQARIQVLRATIGEIEPVVIRTSRPSSRIAKLDAQIELLSAAQPRTILDEFRWRG